MHGAYGLLRISAPIWQAEAGGLADRPVPMPIASPLTPERVLQSSEAALLVDESGNILFANDPACNLLKYSAGELDGQSVERVIPHRYRLAHIGHRLHFTDNRLTRPMGMGLELFALCKDGSECRVDISLNPVRRGLRTLIVATIQLRE
jgi:PAS domain S-box-containing protein